MFDLPEADKKPVSVEVDYSLMLLGQSAGNKKVVTECPICDKPALAKHGDTVLTWLHCEVLTQTPKGGVSRKVISKCTKGRFE